MRTLFYRRDIVPLYEDMDVAHGRKVVGEPETLRWRVCKACKEDRIRGVAARQDRESGSNSTRLRPICLAR